VPSAGGWWTLTPPISWRQARSLAADNAMPRALCRPLTLPSPPGRGCKAGGRKARPYEKQRRRRRGKRQKRPRPDPSSALRGLLGMTRRVERERGSGSAGLPRFPRVAREPRNDASGGGDARPYDDRGAKGTSCAPLDDGRFGADIGIQRQHPIEGGIVEAQAFTTPGGASLWPCTPCQSEVGGRRRR
jgi:hypothetical protein